MTKELFEEIYKLRRDQDKFACEKENEVLKLKNTELENTIKSFNQDEKFIVLTKERGMFGYVHHYSYDSINKSDLVAEYTSRLQDKDSIIADLKLKIENHNAKIFSRKIKC